MCFRPDYVIHRVTEMSPDWLKKQNVKGFLIDIDNTLTPYHSENIPQDIYNWLGGLIETNILFVPYSNARSYRIKNFCDEFQITNPGMALKPLNFGLRKSLRYLRLKKSEVMIVGDQVFTDTLAGKFAGIRVVLVDPVSTKEFPATRVMRKIERFIGRSGWKYDNLE